MKRTRPRGRVLFSLLGAARLGGLAAALVRAAVGGRRGGSGQQGQTQEQGSDTRLHCANPLSSSVRTSDAECSWGSSSPRQGEKRAAGLPVRPDRRDLDQPGLRSGQSQASAREWQNQRARLGQIDRLDGAQAAGLLAGQTTALPAARSRLGPHGGQRQDQRQEEESHHMLPDERQSEKVPQLFRLCAKKASISFQAFSAVTLS